MDGMGIVGVILPLYDVFLIKQLVAICISAKLHICQMVYVVCDYSGADTKPIQFKQKGGPQHVGATRSRLFNCQPVS